MVEVSAEWALVVVSIGLVVTTIIQAFFASRLVRESRALSDATKALVEQSARQLAFDIRKQVGTDDKLFDEYWARVEHDRKSGRN